MTFDKFFYVPKWVPCDHFSWCVLLAVKRHLAMPALIQSCRHGSRHHHHHHHHVAPPLTSLNLSLTRRCVPPHVNRSLKVLLRHWQSVTFLCVEICVCHLASLRVCHPLSRTRHPVGGNMWVYCVVADRFADSQTGWHLNSSLATNRYHICPNQ